VDAGADDGVVFDTGDGVTPELAAGDVPQAASSNASKLISTRACRSDRRFTPTSSYLGAIKGRKARQARCSHLALLPSCVSLLRSNRAEETA
jgi:hypothetical protein